MCWDGDASASRLAGAREWQRLVLSEKCRFILRQEAQEMLCDRIEQSYSLCEEIRPCRTCNQSSGWFRVTCCETVSVESCDSVSRAWSRAVGFQSFWFSFLTYWILNSPCSWNTACKFCPGILIAEFIGVGSRKGACLEPGTSRFSINVIFVITVSSHRSNVSRLSGKRGLLKTKYWMFSLSCCLCEL